MSNVLIVVAHSDDEILGAGCTMLRLIEEGHNVSVVCMTMEAPTRRDAISEIMKDMHKRIGVCETYVYPAKALELEKANRIDCVQFIEQAILQTRADTVITHYKNDLHHDHRIVYELTMEAIRLPQRQPLSNIHPVRHVLSMEIPCSTSWADVAFRPTFFFEANASHLEQKIALMKEYDNVIRSKPHPRSEQNIAAIACMRGAQSNCHHAEAFENVFTRM